MYCLYTCAMFLSGVTERCVCECFEDVQAGFGFSVDVVNVLLECHSHVIGHSKCCGSVDVSYECVVRCAIWLCVIFLGPGCKQCSCGLS